jgi:NADH:ubiquinone oxidoreductase subunit 5 (subunit L)/multisubunit Na+/H+ antiporter MnhA subunit
MSLAAMPPQAGFVSEWFVFQTMFQAFQLSSLTARLTLALAAAGLALTAAVSLATFIKMFGLGLLGEGHRGSVSMPKRISFSIFTLGLFVLGLAIGAPWWLPALRQADINAFGVSVAEAVRSGTLLVPLSAKFAFISPTKLILAGPLLALIPLALLLNSKRFAWRRAPVWYGGMREDPNATATTSLAFSNALRTFYGFVYGPTHNLTREYHERPYFVKRLVFNQEVAPIFGPYLFSPIVKCFRFVAIGIRGLQSGNLNLYTGVIGLLLLLILSVSLLE